MPTRKLYYDDAYTRRFTATVLSCEAAADGRFRVTLDATAFFPEEGGQTADGGTLGGVRVMDVRERGGTVVHLTDGPLAVGAAVDGALDWAERFRKMQNHSGEHILSGVIHRRFGYENVGFHLGADGFLLDYSGELDRAALDALEREANEVVWANIPVRAWFPAPEELAALAYRSKLELTENVRIVQIGDVDACACCAPHVARTGEIGEIKLLDAMRHRGGLRVWAKCGADALRDHRARCEEAAAVSRLLSVPQTELAAGVEKLLAERAALRAELAALRAAALQTQIASLTPTAGDLCLFANADTDGLRELVNAGMALAGGVCAAFSGTDGDYRFVAGSRSADMRLWLKEHRDALLARGGGRPEMVTGSSAAARAQIEAVFA